MYEQYAPANWPLDNREDHEALLVTSQEYNMAFAWAIDIATRKGWTRDELLSAAFRYVNIEGLAAQAIVYAFRYLANKQVAA